MDAMSGWILSVKVLLISAGAVSLAMAVKFSVDEAPAICAAVLPWMRPPYLFVVINAIIIIIAACSRSNQNHRAAEPQRVRYQRSISLRTPPPAYFAPVVATPQVAETEAEAALVVYEGGDRIVELRPVLVNGSEVGAETDEEAESDDTEAEAGDMFQGLTTSLANDNLPEEKFPPELQLECYNPSPASEKPQISPTFPHRNLIRTTTPEGVEEATDEAGQVTLESVWKKITESSREQAGEYLEHSDTAERRRLEKSETFRERRSRRRSPPGQASPGIQKEITPSRDELNRQAEDFIKKVYEEMRLERLESLNKRVVSSGA